MKKETKKKSGRGIQDGTPEKGNLRKGIRERVTWDDKSRRRTQGKSRGKPRKRNTRKTPEKGNH